MATDIYNMLTGGYNPEDERRQQQQAFDQNLGRTTNPQAFIASVMSNMGSKIGGSESLGQQATKDPKDTRDRRKH